MSFRSDKDAVAMAIRKHQLMRSGDLLKIAGSYLQIRRKAEAGVITPLGSGLYAAPSLDPFVAAVLATAKFFPAAVISGLTALVIHGLSDEYIERVDVDIPREKSLRNRLLRVHRVTRERLKGSTQLKFHGQPIRIYDVERSLCDAYRIDPAGPIFFKALKRSLTEKKKVDSEKLRRYDSLLGTRVLMHLQQELASG